MSVENAERLLERMKSDDSLAKKIRATSLDAFEKTTQEEGLPCSMEEVQEALGNRMASEELSEIQLEHVSGGTGW